jgi:hypothetical protein
MVDGVEERDDGHVLEGLKLTQFEFRQKVGNDLVHRVPPFAKKKCQ